VLATGGGQDSVGGGGEESLGKVFIHPVGILRGEDSWRGSINIGKHKVLENNFQKFLGFR